VGKDEKEFALIKKYFCSPTELDTTCKECRSNTNKCTKCGRPISGYSVNRVKNGTVNIILCGRCISHHNKMVVLNKKIKIRNKINHLLKITQYMAGKTIDDLRGHLFKTIEGLMDGSINTDTAVHVSDVAKTIIDSVRVENEFIQLTKSTGTGFIPQNQLTDAAE
jgi:hypothetical protein